MLESKKLERKLPLLEKYEYIPLKINISGEEYYDKLMEMNYHELVQFLINKYGPAKYNYFNDEYCCNKNNHVARSNEGLFCHHIDEDKAIKLSDSEYARKEPFEYQLADRLVYCNWLEHLLLHIIISESNKTNENGETLGIGGVMYIVSQINDYYGGYNYKRQYFVIAGNLIKDDYKSYIKMLKKFYKNCKNSLITLECLSVGWENFIYKDIYNDLIK